MKSSLLLIYPGNESLGKKIAEQTGCEVADFELRSFPDGEMYFRLLSYVKDREVFILCSLDRPDEKMLRLCLIAGAAREHGALSVNLIAPYLGYMRQDSVFKPGESILAKHFGTYLAGNFDSLITVDPHLHRIDSLSRIYPFPSKVIHAAPAIAKWIKQTVPDAFLIGPDAESQQWVAEVASKVGCPYIIGKKERLGDRNVSVHLPDLNYLHHLAPVILDDIISTGCTMRQIVERVNTIAFRTVVCVGVHALFAGDAYQELQKAGAKQIVTCNTIAHESNAIDIASLVCEAIETL